MTYRLTGRYPLGDLTGRDGEHLRFVPSTTVVGDGNIVLPAPVSVTLAAGEFSVDLIGTDDPAYAPSGFVWTVQELMDGGRAPWSFELTADSDISDLTAVATPAEVEYNALASTSVIAGAGLTGGGTLAADRTVAVGAGTGVQVNANSVEVIYGTTAGTAAQGNDSRITGAVQSSDQRVVLSNIVWPQVAAHRFGLYEFGEETLWAGDEAYAAGCRVLEGDWRWSSDGEAVLMHDATVDRTTNGTGTVSAMTAVQIAALRVDTSTMLGATGYADQYVPTLGEAIERYRGRAILIMEQQAGSAASVPTIAAQLRVMGARDVVIVESFTQSIAVAWAGEGFQSMLLTATDVADPAALYATGVRWIGYGFTGTGTAGELARIPLAKAAGLMVATWGHARKEDSDAATAAGSDMPMTDYPAHTIKASGRSDSFSFAGNRIPTGFVPRSRTYAVAGGFLTETGGAVEWSAMFGELGPITDDTFTVRATFKASNVAAGTSWGGVYIAGPTDGIFKATGLTGYHALLRFNGALDLYRINGSTATGIGAVAAGTGTTPALVAGTEYTVEIIVTPTTVTVRRTDTGGSATANDATYRHDFWPHWTRDGASSGLISVKSMEVSA